MLSADDSSLEALEALLTFRRRITTSSSPRVHPEIPVPDPLNPFLPHVIEGDSTPMFCTNENASVARAQMLSTPQAVVSVPNPLDIHSRSSVAERSSASTSMHHQNTSSTTEEEMFFHATADTLSADNDMTKPPDMDTTTTTAVRTDKIQDALNSRPQRGKKRCNLNDEERLELTRTRNREHAKCTRMKKKARHLELVEMEKMYLVLKAQQDLNTSRKTRTVKIINAVCNDNGQEVHACPHISRLRSLAGEKLQHSQMSIAASIAEDEVAMSSHSATVKVSVKGTDYSSGESKNMEAFCSIEFKASSAEISSVSLHWVAPECHQCKMFPSVSTLSFET